MSISTKIAQKKAPSDKSVFKKQENSKSSLNKQNSSAQDILTLHQTIGNQAVQRLFESGFIQGKLTIGKPNDKYEQEADRVADEVMRMPEPRVQRQSEEDEEEEMIQPKPIGEQITPLVQRQVEPEEEEEAEPEKEEEETIQTKSEEQTPQVMQNLESKINALQGGGQPLSRETRNFFEPRFGQDFSNVKVHADSNANHLARSINSRAFTKGSDIVFGGGEYSPWSSNGKRLLGHELTHVVQQRKTSQSIQFKRNKQQSRNLGGRGSGRNQHAREIPYNVTGVTLAQVAEQLNRFDGFAAMTYAPIGIANSEVPQQQPDGTYQVQVQWVIRGATVSLPRWTNYNNTCLAAQREWNRFMRQTRQHEQEAHIDAARSFVTQLGDTDTVITGATVTELRQNLQAKQQDLAARLQTIHDSCTHGIDIDAILHPDNGRCPED